jgi:hypothetical protein
MLILIIKFLDQFPSSLEILSVPAPHAADHAVILQSLPKLFQNLSVFFLANVQFVPSVKFKRI